MCFYVEGTQSEKEKNHGTACPNWNSLPGKMSSEKLLLYHLKGLGKAFVFLHLQKTTILHYTVLHMSQ